MDIDIIKLKELHPSNRLLNRMHKANELVGAFNEDSNTKFYLMNSFELQGKHFVVVFITYEFMNLSKLQREKNESIITMLQKDFKEFINEKDDELLIGTKSKFIRKLVPADEDPDCEIIMSVIPAEA